MGTINILLLVCMFVIAAYLIYMFLHSKYFMVECMFDYKYKQRIKEYTPKVMIRARPFRDSSCPYISDYVKYDVYVLNSFKDFYAYNEMTKFDDDPKALMNTYNHDFQVLDMSPSELEVNIRCLDSSHANLDSAKARAKTILDKINSSNIYTESAEFNSKEIKEFNTTLNDLSNIC